MEVASTNRLSLLRASLAGAACAVALLAAAAVNGPNAGAGITVIGDGERTGEFFTLGFRGSDDTFVILAREEKAIRELREDLAKPRSERRIVSGVVRPGKPYNRPWSYVMGGGSIVLGEVFIEVCDASPRYVEQHRDQWLGERWCPWSSYVKRAGR